MLRIRGKHSELKRFGFNGPSQIQRYRYLARITSVQKPAITSLLIIVGDQCRHDRDMRMALWDKFDSELPWQQVRRMNRGQLLTRYYKHQQEIKPLTDYLLAKDAAERAKAGVTRVSPLQLLKLKTQTAIAAETVVTPDAVSR